MTRKPEWLKIQIKKGERFGVVQETIRAHELHTICSSGLCPNRHHCWNLGTATFMILGEICTRSCRFCATKTGKPLPPDPDEPTKVADSILKMNLKHGVITSVDRDDLPDKGAGHWADTVRKIKEKNPTLVIELLIPDYDLPELKIVMDSSPDIIAHNLETVERLTPVVRGKATYSHSLQVLENIAAHGFFAKTGIMVGLGETTEEVEQVLRDSRKVGCRAITIGQYLQPTLAHIPVAEYVLPSRFEQYKKMGEKMGFDYIEAAPLVRSSFMAGESFAQIQAKIKASR
ncbi:MAG: lipoyl synthase [Bacteroidales bacterium]|jgi:lipoic acid synthetase|nr:lipoyl synthase [Bacteroidales bacterium]